MKPAQSGAKMLAITGFTPNTLQQQADTACTPSPKSRRPAVRRFPPPPRNMSLTDLLFMALVQQDMEHAPERIRHSEELVKKLV